MGGSQSQLQDLNSQETQSQLQDVVQQQTNELSVHRSLLIELHTNLSLHAVRASRIALRSLELSREERSLALASLETKEQQIRSDMEGVRERHEDLPLQSL